MFQRLNRNMEISDDWDDFETVETTGWQPPQSPKVRWLATKLGGVP